MPRLRAALLYALLVFSPLPAPCRCKDGIVRNELLVNEGIGPFAGDHSPRVVEKLLAGCMPSRDRSVRNGLTITRADIGL